MNDVRKRNSSELPVTSAKEAGLSAAGLARLSEVMRREVDTKHVPGIAMLISRGGKIAYRENVGRLRPGGPPMRADGIFRIYSMTKPIVSVAAMMLVEEGRLFLSDPLAKYVPEFAEPKVGIEVRGKLKLVPAARPITIQDLFRHTSGLTYGFTGTSLVQKLYVEGALLSQDQTNATHVAALAKLPLLNQPGTYWDYGHSTDVIGRVVEIISGQSLGGFLEQRIFAPLGMIDTGFHAAPEKHDRLAEPFETDPDTGAAVKLIETRVPPRFASAGGGLVSTMEDYARFAHMLFHGGTLNCVRILGRKTVAYMASDHLGPNVKIGAELLPPGHGFGLGFAVRLAEGMAPTPGTVGEFYWGGIAGTAFFIAPKEELVAIMLVQAPGQRLYYRQLFRYLVHAALD
jgi:CubicO group peptidase (beta-lactamase class C family)